MLPGQVSHQKVFVKCPESTFDAKSNDFVANSGEFFLRLALVCKPLLVPRLLLDVDLPPPGVAFEHRRVDDCGPLAMKLMVRLRRAGFTGITITHVHVLTLSLVPLVLCFFPLLSALAVQPVQPLNANEFGLVLPFWSSASGRRFEVASNWMLHTRSYPFVVSPISPAALPQSAVKSDSFHRLWRRM